MIFLRHILKWHLKRLSDLAIKKHKIEIVVVTGWFGTRLASEMLYSVLSDKYKVRRNIKNLNWDFCLPLAILGYKDKKRSIFGWILLILRARTTLIFGQKNPHILILSANSSLESTAKYWSSFIKPDYLVILNQENKNSLLTEELIKSTNKKKGIIVYNPEKVAKNISETLEKFHTKSYGENPKNDLVLKNSKEMLNMKYEKQEINLPVKRLPEFSKDVLGAVTLISLLKDMELSEIGYNSVKFELPNSFITKIRSNLKLGIPQ